MDDKDVIAHLASGAKLRRHGDDGTEVELVTFHDVVTPDQWNRLADGGWLKGFANGGGAWLSDEGRRAYLRSTDEMGDGKLVPPVTPNQELTAAQGEKP